MKNKLVIVILLLHLALLIVERFTAWPEMLLWPFLIAKGWLPYQDIAIVHTPLLFLITSLVFRFSGFNLISLKIFTWGLILLTDVLIYTVFSRIFNSRLAVRLFLFMPCYKSNMPAMPCLIWH